jgi:hypothetical protein
MDAKRGPPGPDTPRGLLRARRISRVLDDLIRIPGTRRRVGLDPLVGLLPGVGDWVTLVISLDLLFSAARLGAGVAVLFRMSGNLLIDALLGMVPLLGDLFDFRWKANKRNLILLESLVHDREGTRRRSVWLIRAILAAAVGVVASGIWVGWLVLRWLIGLV